MHLKNRIIMPPMLTRYVNDDGSISERMLNYYAERARGGCALLIVEASYPRFGVYPGRIFIGRDECVLGLNKLVHVIRSGGARVGIEINPHRGRRDEIDPASASETVNPQTGARVRELGISEIKELVETFGDAARRVKEAGFDCIMIHGGSGYLVSEFLSTRINKRIDGYGGAIKRRARFALELVTKAKETVGVDYPVIFRLTADERVDGGFGLDDAVLVSKFLEEAGADAIDVTSGAAEAHQWSVPNMLMPRGLNAVISEALKREVTIPVSVAGGINDPNLAEEILREGKSDFIDVGRGLIADPHFPNKAFVGNEADIRRCVLCGRCSESILKQPVRSMICSVNPAVGKEKEFEFRLNRATRTKKVLVIGGGPAGMEASIVAAQRGHDVILWEKDCKLGGQLNLAAAPPGKDELISLIEYLKRQIDRLKIPVGLNKKAMAEKISKLSFDAIVIAIGSKPLIPP
jgi:2,4-dienoyl-CoA reductase-like NADH-dependent reductase (Old Yellow Enzyme family)